MFLWRYGDHAMSERFSIGFIGFGEAAFEIAKGLRSAGLNRMCLCDIRTHDPEKAVLVIKRAQETGVAILDSVGEVGEQSDIILSLVAPEASVAVAKEAADHLKPGQLYVDLTSSFPDEMKTAAAVLGQRGAKFVDGAMMGAVPVYGHRVLIYAAGIHAEEAARTLGRYGMNLKVVSPEPGQASAIKLILSIATKGFEALLVEMLLAAHHYRLEEPVLAALNQFFAKGLDSVVDRFVGSDAIHAGRRTKEMESCARFLERTGVDPVMTKATIQRLRWTASLKLDEFFAGITPENYKDVIQAWDTIGLLDRREK
jgi:3-hydroxyisobutyrate dehydrogenase-like beta-hydroxyacid dehydrogenase